VAKGVNELSRTCSPEPLGEPLRTVVPAPDDGPATGFQPHGVLVSRGALRADRRRFNEAVLDTGHPLHRYAERIARGARADRTRARCRSRGGAGDVVRRRP
jgi:hypothetical protein